MSEEIKVNDGVAGPAEKPVFNPKQETLSKDVVIQKSSKLLEKTLSLIWAGMKRHVVVKKPDGKELIRIPLTLFIVAIVLSQFIVLVIAAVLVVFFKWKIELEEKNPPVETPPSPVSPTPPQSAESNPSGYSEPTLPPMPT